MSVEVKVRANRSRCAARSTATVLATRGGNRNRPTPSLFFCARTIINRAIAGELHDPTSTDRHAERDSADSIQIRRLLHVSDLQSALAELLVEVVEAAPRELHAAAAMSKAQASGSASRGRDMGGALLVRGCRASSAPCN